MEKWKVTGIGRYLMNFLRYATAAHKEYRFILYGNQFTRLDYQSPNLTLKIILERATVTYDQILLPAYLKNDRVDIFLSPYVKAPVFSPCPYITTIHDLLFLVTPEYTGWRYKPYNEVFKIFGRTVSKRAAAIIADSESSKRDIIKIFGVPEGKIHVVPLGISEEYKPVSDRGLIENTKKDYGITGRYILYVGNFKPHKNIGRLIEAFADTTQALGLELQDIKLVLGGKRDRFVSSLKELAEKLGIRDRIIFTDFIKDEDLPALYSGAEIFIYPSLYEGFGLPVLEAMACGTPVISSNTSSLPEVVGDSGILIDAKEPKNIAAAIIALLENDRQREILRGKGLARAKEFTVEKYSSKILSLIETIAHSPLAGSGLQPEPKH
ncbi:MAG: glycosyltransferase family 4 protein [Nitrospinae bacterium]|nr:glycosyltransferase family 4 protein [Nitrospinota bacterium]